MSVTSSCGEVQQTADSMSGSETAKASVSQVFPGVASQLRRTSYALPTIPKKEIFVVFLWCPKCELSVDKMMNISVKLLSYPECLIFVPFSLTQYDHKFVIIRKAG